MLLPNMLLHPEVFVLLRYDGTEQFLSTRIPLPFVGFETVSNKLNSAIIESLYLAKIISRGC
jgi:hypothetical protein